MKILFAVVLLGLSGCVLRVRGRPSDEPPPPPPVEVHRGVSRDDAVAIAMNVAAQRQLGAQPKEVKRDDKRWKVKLAIWRGERRGEMKVDVDAYSGAVMKVKEKLKKRDDDDDDDDHDDDD